jgi:hypothetical protein
MCDLLGYSSAIVKVSLDFEVNHGWSTMFTTVKEQNWETIRQSGLHFATATPKSAPGKPSGEKISQTREMA